MLLLDSVCGMISVVLEVHERECCLLVLNLVSSTLSCIRQPRPRLIIGPDLRVAVLVLPILVDVVVPPTRIVV
jgi:hypothetical protein